MDCLRAKLAVGRRPDIVSAELERVTLEPYTQPTHPGLKVGCALATAGCAEDSLEIEQGVRRP